MAHDPEHGESWQDTMAREARSAATTEPLTTVYCKWCNKTHVVRPDEQECGFPGTWSFEGEPWPTDKEQSRV